MFQRFAKNTSMHGIREISEIKNVFGKSIWSTIIIFAFSMTIFQVYRGINQFLNQSTVTNMAPAKEEEIVYPSFMICAPHWMYWVDFKKAYSMNFTKPMILYALSFMTNIHSHIIFDVTETRRELLLYMKMYNITKLSQFYETIANPFPLSLINNNETKPTEMYGSIKINQQSNTYLFCYTVSGEEVSKLLNNGHYTYIVHDLSYSIIKDEISENEYNFNLLHLLNVYGVYKMNYIDKTKNFTTIGFPWKFFPANDRNFMDIGTDKAWYVSQLTISAYRIQNVPQRPCEKDLKWDYANVTEQKKCNALFRLKSCECLELEEAILLGRDTIEEVCSKEIKFVDNAGINIGRKQQICFENTAAKIELEHCIKKVPTPCEIWHYDYSQTDSQFSSKLVSVLEKISTVIELSYPHPSQVLITTEIDVQTWESFIASIGGVLGIWTGASVVSLVQLFYLVCTYREEKR